MATEEYKQTMEELYKNYVDLRAKQAEAVQFSFREYVDNYWKFKEYHFISTDDDLSEELADDEILED